MTTSRLHNRAGKSSGMSLVELTVVILVVLLFLGMTFLGVQGWKRASDRANCVLNIRHMQMAVRGYSNSYSLRPGEDTTALSPPVELESVLIGADRYFADTPVCPGQGAYELGGNSIPPIGSLYMTCSLGGSNGHVPNEFGSW